MIVVTGLPRSGTSMAMQMLAAGGVAALADDQRLPDKNNPRGESAPPYLVVHMRRPIDEVVGDSSAMSDSSALRQACSCGSASGRTSRLNGAP